ncbi:MAG TPA: class I SAM-dependent methyltransferase [Ignavibacteriaceae bacterium]|nr:class I SAM-dependent methyltransferase [Ignavibacteriaceae bacterium]
MSKVFLKKDRDKSLKRKHPWVFSGAIERTDSQIKIGETVNVISSSGKIIGKGAYSPDSQIRVRMWTFNPDEEIDMAFFSKKISCAIKLRKQLINNYTNAYRIINAENDGLPGVVVDKYSKYLSCQFLSAGAEFWKQEIVSCLIELLNPVSVYERSDSDVRLKEGLSHSTGLLYGEPVADLIEIDENGLKFLVDIKAGHKTGFYLDQRDNRLLLSSFVKDKTILNCFSYTGAFTVYALNSSAKEVTSIDTSLTALEMLNKNVELNNLRTSKWNNLNDDTFKVLRKFRDERKTFDVIILDPPKFAESVSQIQQASRGYKDINLLAIKLLNPGGTLFTFSCSGHITPDLFNKIVSDAALDSGEEVRVVKYLTQSTDHIITPNFPEGLYLKGLVLKSI